jgi:hypothetical protein
MQIQTKTNQPVQVLPGNDVEIHDMLALDSHSIDAPTDCLMPNCHGGIRNAVVTSLANIRAPGNFSNISLFDALELIRGDKYKAKIEAAREILRAHGKERYKEFKRNNLPTFAFNGTFNGMVVNNDNFDLSSGIFHFDIDGLSPDTVLAVKAELCQLPGLVFLFVSPSGKGLKGGLRIDPAMVKNDADFKAVFARAQTFFSGLGVTIDRTCSDVRRLCFVSHDSDIYTNWNAELWEWRPPIETAQPPTKPNTSQKYQQPTVESESECLKRIAKIMESAAPGERHNARLRAGNLAGGYVAGGLLEEDLARDILEQLSDAISDGSATDKSELKTLQDAFERGKKQPITSTRLSQALNPVSKDASHKKSFSLVPIKYLLENHISIKWHIQGFIEKGGMNLISGPYGSGKSFVVFDMAFCIAAGIDWHGNKVVQTPVVILAGEGHSGISNRFAALALAYGIPCPDHLFISQMPASLTGDNANVTGVAEAVDQVCPDAGFIIIDTLNRNFGGGDENSTKDMTSFINNVDRIFRETGKTVVVVHHTGHTDSSRGRGSSALPAACESEFIVKKDESGLTLSNEKQKNGHKADTLRFTFKQILLPEQFDDDNGAVSSLVLECEGVAKKSAKVHEESSREKFILAALHEAIANHGLDTTSTEIKGIFSGFESLLEGVGKIVHIDAWRGFAYPKIITDKPDTKRKAFLTTRNKLSELNKVGCFKDYWWPIDG